MNAVQQVKDRVQGRTDQDFYVNFLAKHPAHIARSKAKAARYRQVNSFIREHPILWKLGVRPPKPRRKRAA